MTSEMNTNVHLVRCPKCQLVLPELPEIPVYKCGGCNIVLQAKNRNRDTKETRFEYAKTDENGLKDEDKLNMKHLECKEDSPTDKKSQNNSISCQEDIVGNHVLGDENSSWDRGIRLSDDDDDSIEITSIDIDVVSSLDDDTDHWTEADEIVSENTKMGCCSKDSSFYNDMLLDSSSPESGLNKQKGKSVKHSRQYRVGSDIASQGKRGADELFKDWTFKGLKAEQLEPESKPGFGHGVDFSKSSSSKPPRRTSCNESGVLNTLSSKMEMHCTGYKRHGFQDPVSLFQDTNHVPRIPTNSRVVVQRNDLSACSYHNSGLCSPDTPLYNEPNKSELLKMINKLKDEIKRTRISNIRFSGEHIQTHYMSHEPRVSRMSRLIEPSFYSNQTLYKGSCSSTPSHHQHPVKELSSSKRYIRPISGGNPFITCYHCTELLQMPVDFIISGRRHHKLRCNSCRKTMEFSISGKGHLTPCIIDVVAPPPSMVDDYNDSRSDTREARVRLENSELSPRSRSRSAALHRLMGYSSISQVIRPRKSHK